MNCQRAICSAYRSDQYADPKGFAVQLAVVLELYPDEVIRYVSNPVTGIQHQSKFPPSIAEVVEACDKFQVELELSRQRVKAEIEAQSAARLGQFEPAIHKLVGEENFWSWFSQMRLVSQTTDEITLAVRSEFFRAEIYKRFSDQILEASGCKRFHLKVDPALIGINRGPAISTVRWNCTERRGTGGN